MKINKAYRQKRQIAYLIRKINKITTERDFYRNKINELTTQYKYEELSRRRNTHRGRL